MLYLSPKKIVKRNNRKEEKKRKKNLNLLFTNKLIKNARIIIEKINLEAFISIKVVSRNKNVLIWGAFFNIFNNVKSKRSTITK
jgi:hypothetical protein